MNSTNYRDGRRPALLRAASLILESDDAGVKSPDRLRKEYMAAFLVVIFPIILATLSIDVIHGLDAFTVVQVGLAVIVAAAILLIRAKKFDAAFITLFLGGSIAVCVGLVPAALGKTDSAALVPFASMLFFAALVLNGLYVRSVGIGTAILLLVITFDTAEQIISGGRTLPEINARLGVVIAHLIAFGAGSFLKNYFEHLCRTAEARSLMVRNLEMLVEEARTLGVSRLETFSHDIRSPITSIMGVQALLASTELNEEQQQYVDILSRSNRLLLDLVQSILDPDFSGAQDKKTAALLAPAAERILAPYRVVASARGIELRLDIPADAPIPPVTAANLQRILSNLIDNALKYTEEGTILLEARRDEKGSLTIAVEDTGRGMDAERITRIMDGTVKPDKTFDSSRGLGLQGVRRMVEEAGGSLTLTAEPGEGSRVELRFPM